MLLNRGFILLCLDSFIYVFMLIPLFIECLTCLYYFIWFYVYMLLCRFVLNRLF